MCRLYYQTNSNCATKQANLQDKTDREKATRRKQEPQRESSREQQQKKKNAISPPPSKMKLALDKRVGQALSKFPRAPGQESRGPRDGGGQLRVCD